MNLLQLLSTTKQKRPDIQIDLLPGEKADIYLVEGNDIVFKLQTLSCKELACFCAGIIL